MREMVLSYMIYITICVVLLGLMGSVLKFTMAGLRFVQESALKFVERMLVLGLLSIVFCFSSGVCGYVLKLALKLVIG